MTKNKTPDETLFPTKPSKYKCTDEQYANLHIQADRRGKTVDVDRQALANFLQDHATIRAELFKLTGDNI